MKNYLFIFLILAFSINAVAKENYPKLPEVKGLASLNNLKTNSSFDKSIDLKMDLLNSKSEFTPLTLNSKKTDKNAYKPKKFNFSIMPYAWLVSVGGTVGYIDGQKFGFNKSFTDALKYLKMAASVSGKFKYERVSFVYDIAYFNLKGFGTEIDAASTPNIASANWTVKQTLYDLFIAYLFPSKSKKIMVDVYGGGRLIVLNTATTIVATSNGAQRMSSYDNSYLNPVIGVNAEYVLDQKAKWVAWSKGDIGGFGVNSEMTWQLNAGFGYMLSPQVPLTLGFKYIGINHDKNQFAWQVNEYGFTIGIGYRY